MGVEAPAADWGRVLRMIMGGLAGLASGLPVVGRLGSWGMEYLRIHRFDSLSGYKR